MSRRKHEMTDDNDGSDFDSPGAHIIETSLQDEISDSYLEYAYSVISSRALPDAKDGLKPVHRRILFGMRESGLRPEHAHVKSARVVGDVLGRYHPHGDSSVYDALVRMAQPFSLNVPLVDGHGNFGSPNDGPAAMRYTECRLQNAAMGLVGELGEGTVDFIPTYDGSGSEPTVLPASYPNLLVNGSSGIAVGMATNMIPHNLGETIAAARALIRKPNMSLDKLMEIILGPDLPTGGILIGLDQVRQAYETGKGSVRIRAKVETSPIPGSRGRQSITITELPYQVGTEKIIDGIKQEIAKKRLNGVADVKDLSDRRNGIRLVIECKTGVNPQALLAELYKYTPMETSFGISNLALVDGVPKTLTLKELLDVFLAHRYDVVTRRTQYRLDKAEARKHIVEGFLIALDNIDAVVKLIRESKDTAEAKNGLIKKFKLSDIQATHILEMPLRRLVNLEVIALREELAELLKVIAELEAILADDKVLRALVDKELAAFSKEFATERKTSLLDGDLKEILASTAPSGPLEIKDDPCQVFFSTTGLLMRTAAASEETEKGSKKRARAKHDTILAVVDATARGQILAVTNRGRAFRCDVVGIPTLPEHAGAVSLRGGASAREFVPLMPGETVITIAPLDENIMKTGVGIALGTRNGVVKVCAPDWPLRSDEFTLMGLKDDDEIIGGNWVKSENDTLVFVSTDSSLLRFPANKVRPQGRSGSGMAGIRLAKNMVAQTFNVVSEKAENPVVVTHTGSSTKTTLFKEYPAKGRGTGGVRSHRFLREEKELTTAFVGEDPGAANKNGTPQSLPKTMGRRDGSGVAGEPINLLGSLVER